MTADSSPPKFSLNKAQEQAVANIEGPLLVVAGAGSGKTRVIVEKIAHLIEKGMEPKNILAITFTNKAANDMRERLAYIDTTRMWVCTFHSMCVRILRRDAPHLGLSENFSIFATDDQKTIIKAVLKERELDPAEWKPSDILARISNCKSEGLKPEDVSDETDHYRDRLFTKVYEDYQKALFSNQALDFDDLLLKTIELFEKHETVLERYQNDFKYILVDEYQDTNMVQYRLIRFLSKKCQGVMCTGDPDQSIYSWRGADINNIMNFEKDFKDSETIVMEENYRSTQNILELSNQLIRHNTLRYEKDLTSNNTFGELPVLYTMLDAEAEAEKVADLINHKRSDGVSMSDIAVFYRTNAQSRALEQEMGARGISYRLVGGTLFYERMEIKDIIAYLRFIHNPSDSVSLMRIVNKPARGISETTKGKIRLYSDDNGLSCWESMISESFLKSLPKRAGEAVLQFNTMMADFFEHSFDSPDKLVERIVETTKIIDSYTKKNGEIEEDRIENIKEFMGFVKLFCDNNPGANLSNLMEKIALENEKSENNSDEAEEEKVTLMTLHAAKGLEFPVVYFVGLDENILPHKRSIDDAELNSIEEERRLCYVGITRAQKEISLFNVRERNVYNKTEIYNPSRFISEMEGEYLTINKSKPKRKPKKNIFTKKPISNFGNFNGIHKGAPVRHDEYGNGIVIDLIGLGDETCAKVYFNENTGIKEIMLASEPLKKL